MMLRSLNLLQKADQYQFQKTTNIRRKSPKQNLENNQMWIRSTFFISFCTGAAVQSASKIMKRIK